LKKWSARSATALQAGPGARVIAKPRYSSVIAKPLGRSNLSVRLLRPPAGGLAMTVVSTVNSQ